ncbi:hypothetical protein Ddye_015124 [Dipteronia dyeriana]|uniref:Reverse transcriptase domain-containing protein n=1 Tax=Dipteronia dyeriana TaxID=168575 RepID=A0AAD9U545_9ROSI|nr:hypothetical protein Ddye_015124 [Dipteronia dyeriana]
MYGIGRTSNRKFGDMWKGKENAEEDDCSVERWRKKSQTSVQKKVEGCIEPIQRRIDTDKSIISSEGKIVPGVKYYGKSKMEKQKELMIVDERGNEHGVGNHSPFAGVECIGKMEGSLGLVTSNGLAQRFNLWSLLRRLTEASNLPWVCLRDFNEMMCDDEKVGGLRKNWQDISEFREAVEACELDNMGFVGNKFTWSNKRDGVAAISKRLDMGLFVLEENLNLTLQIEEWYWRQHVKVEWLQNGDKNSRFSIPKHLPGKREIKFMGCWIVLEYGKNQRMTWLESKDDMARIISLYFDELFLSSKPSQEDIENVLVGIQPSVPTQVVNLIMECVSTVTYSFKLNEEILGNIIPSRGQRQGDPLSPYLFLFCAKGLSNLIRQTQLCGDISGFKCSRRGPTISYIFFTDDILLFTKANDRNCREVRKVLEIYSKASGHMVNYKKLAMYFSSSISEREGERLAAASRSEHSFVLGSGGGGGGGGGGGREGNEKSRKMH